jgi:hypothetical protein
MTNGQVTLSAAADLAVGSMCPPFFGPALLSVEHLVGPDPQVRPFLQGQTDMPALLREGGIFLRE